MASDTHQLTTSNFIIFLCAWVTKVILITILRCHVEDEAVHDVTSFSSTVSAPYIQIV